jgi:hypothetical protein
MAFQLVQILYWLALATWFGGVLFVAVAAPVIFRTVRESNPVLPNVLSVNLEGQHGTLLAGTIVSNLLTQLRFLQAACAAVLLVTQIAQLFTVDLNGSNGAAAGVRAMLFLGAVGALLYEWLYIAPRIERHRQEYLDHADEPDVANPAKEKFDDFHRRSVTAMLGMLLCLSGMILFSAAVLPKSRGAPINVPPAAVEQAG